MPDAATEFLATFNDPAKWDKVLTAVPLFKEHERPGRDGQPVKVDRARLERIAANVRGKVLVGLDGHTKLVRDKDGRLQFAPQHEQPGVLSYYANARMGEHDSRPALVADEYVVKGKAEVHRQRPFRSVEFTTASDHIHAVSVQVTPPALDLGVISYATPDGPRYLEFYELPLPGGPFGQNDPARPPDAAGPDDALLQKVHQAIKDCLMQYPAIAALMNAPAAPGLNAPGQPPAPPPAPAAAPPPAAAAPPGQPPGQKPPERYAMPDTLPEQYTAELAKRDEKIAAMEKQLLLADFKAELSPLCEQYGLDLADELADVDALDRAAFDKHKARLAKRCERVEQYQKEKVDDPTIGPRGLIDTFDGPPAPEPTAGGNPRLHKELVGDKADVARFEQYSRAFPEADLEEMEAFVESAEKNPRVFRAKLGAAK